MLVDQKTLKKQENINRIDSERIDYSIDYEKAFDQVKHMKLFKILDKRV